MNENWSPWITYKYFSAERVKSPVLFPASSETSVSLILAWCWATGSDIDPTLSQHWYDISCFVVTCLSGSHQNIMKYYLKPLPWQHLWRISIHNAVSTRHWTNAGLLLAHRLRRWTSIKPALHHARHWCWFNDGVTLNYAGTNIL